jgi:hypothetical protein
MNNNKDLDRAGLHKSWLKISGTYPVNAMMREFSTIARVVSLQILPFDDCSVHVQFKEPIDELKVMEMVQPNSMTAGAKPGPVPLNPETPTLQAINIYLAVSTTTIYIN